MSMIERDASEQTAKLMEALPLLQELARPKEPRIAFKEKGGDSPY